MSDTEVDPIWDATEPFAEQTRPEPKSSRKKKSGTEAEIDLPETDELPEPVEPGELIDGSEDDLSALEELSKDAPLEVAVDLEERARGNAEKAAVRKRSEPMSEEKTKTKAEWIRDEIAQRKADGAETIRPRDIIAALAEKGVTVTAPQVSVTLRDFDKPKTDKPAKTIKSGKLAAATKAVEKAKAREPKRATAKVSAVAAKPAPAANRPSYEALEAAADFVKGSGGLDTARQLLDAYAKLFNPAG
jgi:hypothetical protein